MELQPGFLQNPAGGASEPGLEIPDRFAFGKTLGRTVECRVGQMFGIGGSRPGEECNQIPAEILEFPYRVDPIVRDALKSRSKASGVSDHRARFETGGSSSNPLLL